MRYTMDWGVDLAFRLSSDATRFITTAFTGEKTLYHMPSNTVFNCHCPITAPRMYWSKGQMIVCVYISLPHLCRVGLRGGVLLRGRILLIWQNLWGIHIDSQHYGNIGLMVCPMGGTAPRSWCPYKPCGSVPLPLLDLVLTYKVL